MKTRTRRTNKIYAGIHFSSNRTTYIFPLLSFQKEQRLDHHISCGCRDVSKYLSKKIIDVSKNYLLLRVYVTSECNCFCCLFFSAVPAHIHKNGFNCVIVTKNFNVRLLVTYNHVHIRYIGYVEIIYYRK